MTESTDGKEEVFRAAVNELIQEWREPEWQRDRKKPVEILASQIARKYQLDMLVLIREGRRRDPWLGQRRFLESGIRNP